MTVLLDQGNRYGAAALLRQLVEVECLTWAFAEDEDEAMRWIRSTREERLQFWQPRHIRSRAAGRFRGIDYALHCEKGGHPSPEGNCLLPAHSGAEPDFFAWHDLAFHGQSAWDYTLTAADKLDYGDEIRELAVAQALSDAERRRNSDPLVPLLAEAMEMLEANQSSTGA